MEWKKVKWLIIALLLAVNIFLGINIAIRYSAALNHEKQDLRRAISLTEDSLGFKYEYFKDLPRYLYSFSGVRDISAEEAFALTLLGENGKLEASGGGVYTYVLPSKERFIFRRSGSVEGIVPAPAEDPAEFISEALKNQDFDIVKAERGIKLEFDGSLIYNAALEYTVAGTYMSVSGRLPLCDEWEKTQKSRSRGEMVLALAQAVTANNMGNLQSVSAVYFIESDNANELRLTPSWVAQCSGGKIVISIADKSVLSVEK